MQGPAHPVLEGALQGRASPGSACPGFLPHCAHIPRSQHLSCLPSATLSVHWTRSHTSKSARRGDTQPVCPDADGCSFLGTQGLERSGRARVVRAERGGVGPTPAVLCGDVRGPGTLTWVPPPFVAEEAAQEVQCLARGRKEGLEAPALERRRARGHRLPRAPLAVRTGRGEAAVVICV